MFPAPNKGDEGLLVSVLNPLVTASVSAAGMNLSQPHFFIQKIEFDQTCIVTSFEIAKSLIRFGDFDPSFKVIEGLGLFSVLRRPQRDSILYPRYSRTNRWNSLNLHEFIIGTNLGIKIKGGLKCIKLLYVYTSVISAMLTKRIN